MPALISTRSWPGVTACQEVHEIIIISPRNNNKENNTKLPYASKSASLPKTSKKRYHERQNESESDKSGESR